MNGELSWRLNHYQYDRARKRKPTGVVLMQVDRRVAQFRSDTLPAVLREKSEVIRWLLIVIRGARWRDGQRRSVAQPVLGNGEVYSVEFDERRATLIPSAGHRVQ